jgi:translation initiation factor RLI1
LSWSETSPRANATRGRVNPELPGSLPELLVAALEPGPVRQVLKSGGNVLLLDEPTNDLDVDTLRALGAGLESFPGCAVVISHDRWFLDRIATHVLAFEGDSAVR